jgi:hypothetical protein
MNNGCRLGLIVSQDTQLRFFLLFSSYPSLYPCPRRSGCSAVYKHYSYCGRFLRNLKVLRSTLRSSSWLCFNQAAFESFPPSKRACKQLTSQPNLTSFYKNGLVMSGAYPLNALCKFYLTLTSDDGDSSIPSLPWLLM